MNHPQPFTTAEIEAMRNPCYCQRDRGDPKGCTRCRTLATFDAMAEDLRTTGVVATNALDDLSKARSQIAALSVGPTVPIQCPDCGTDMRAAAVTRKAPAPALPDAELAELERLHAEATRTYPDTPYEGLPHPEGVVASLQCWAKCREVLPSLLARLRAAEAVCEAMSPFYESAIDKESACVHPKYRHSYNPDHHVEITITVGEVQALHDALTAHAASRSKT